MADLTGYVSWSRTLGDVKIWPKRALGDACRRSISSHDRQPIGGFVILCGGSYSTPYTMSPSRWMLNRDHAGHEASPYRWLACLGISQPGVDGIRRRPAVALSTRGIVSHPQKSLGRDDFADSTDAQVDDPSAGG
jgi:hypothetical protein